MRHFDEAEVVAHLNEEVAFDAAEQVFKALGRGEASAFPSVRNAIGHKDALFGNKSGFDRVSGALGLKAGGYWCRNSEHGLANHQSITLLFDPDTGRPLASFAGNHLTAMRTGAASAVAIDRLARRDVSTLGIVGAGHHAAFHLRAALRVRHFATIRIWNRTAERAEILASQFAGMGLSVQSCPLDEVVERSHVVVTSVSSFAEVVPAGLVRAGTHISAMGADTAGKQELAVELVASARVFADDREQSATLGEAQHAIARGLLPRAHVVPLADVVVGAHPGRRAADEITLYDGTGLGLQDLVTAKAVLSRMSVRGASK